MYESLRDNSGLRLDLIVTPKGLGLLQAGFIKDVISNIGILARTLKNYDPLRLLPRLTFNTLDNPKLLK
jgi:hypothetical protein